MLHWIFIGCALALVLLTILLLAQRLLKSDAGNVREWARIEENVEALRYEYDRAVAAKKAGRMTDEEFRERESELVLRTLDETALPDESAKAQSHTLLMATIAAIAVMVPATTTGLYLYYGDYSSLDPKAQEQIRATREAMQSQRNMFETVKRLEAGVVSQPDNLEAWEILAEHYAHIADKPYYPPLAAFMGRRPVIILVLEGEGAVAKVRKLIGPTNSEAAAAGTIRGDFGDNTRENIVHASDSPENAEIEINRFFAPNEVFSIS